MFCCTYLEHDGTETRIRFSTLKMARFAAALANAGGHYRAAWAAMY